MSNAKLRIFGAVLVITAAVIYSFYRLMYIGEISSTLNLAVALCEISALALISVEAVLVATKTKSIPRKQDEGVLIESAKQVLLTNKSAKQINSSNQVLTDTQQITQVDSEFNLSPADVCVFAQEATFDELRRCFLSLKLVKHTENIYVVTSRDSDTELIDEFGFIKIENISSINAATNKILVCRGTDIIYPDAIEISSTYDISPNTYLELRNVFSNNKALGENGLVEINDKRQAIRESLATRSLSTWSGGPAIVSSENLSATNTAQTAFDFYKKLQHSGVHGTITQEIISEEISREPIVSEVEWRALDYKFNLHVLRNKYTKGSRLIGGCIKLWSFLTTLSVARRLAGIALVLTFVLNPSLFSFVTRNYLVAAISVLILCLAGGALAGDRRTLVTRIREFYYDVEANFFHLYKKYLSIETKGTDRSIVRKLPFVSAILIAADTALVYRVFRQYNDAAETLTDNLIKNISLFSGYVLIVTLLVGLGMVVVRQTRSAMRREISRGANLNSEPVSMVDLSTGGAGCISVSPFELNQVLTFETSFPINGENVKFSCNAVVKSCVEWNGTHRVGLSFEELTQKQLDMLETYCSIIYPHSQARENAVSTDSKDKMHGRAEKRFLAYAASFVALGAIIFSNITTWG